MPSMVTLLLFVHSLQSIEGGIKWRYAEWTDKVPNVLQQSRKNASLRGTLEVERSSHYLTYFTYLSQPSLPYFVATSQVD